MRIVGGDLRGRRIPVKPEPGTRPTSDRVREALGSALDARAAIRGARVLDLYSGTGALAFEALSRGAEHAVLVDSSRKVCAALRKSAAALGLEDRSQVMSLDLTKRGVAKRLGGPFDLVFADPPYAMASALTALFEELLPSLAEDAIVVVESASKEPPDLASLDLAAIATYRYGDTAVAFWSPRGGAQES